MVLVLSEYAREAAQRYYPAVPKERFVLTRNGIDPSLFQIEPHKEGCKVVYSSSPDRGLDRLLDYWPDIREIAPDAELHVYYGFDTWEKISEVRQDQAAKMQIGFYRFRMKKMAEQGVFSHGRVGQEELARAYLGASMWLYPTNFHETSCITAMEAQAAMALPITSKLGALAETVKHGWLVDPPNTRMGYKEEFLNHVRDCVGHDRALLSLIQTILRMGREWACQKMGWDAVAKQWEELFAGRLQ
jgi:glycosyltransferase involved in cell wall biosynthesis